MALAMPRASVAVVAKSAEKRRRLIARVDGGPHGQALHAGLDALDIRLGEHELVEEDVAQGAEGDLLNGPPDPSRKSLRPFPLGTPLPPRMPALRRRPGMQQSR
jgi:hypothetical protein